jgi:hypothetical protein
VHFVSITSEASQDDNFIKEDNFITIEWNSGGVKKSISSPFKRLQAPLSYEKTDAELEASARANPEKWTTGFKKAPPPEKSTKELEAECKMLRSLAEPKKSLPSDYKRTMQSLHCSKRSDEIL